MFKLKLLEIETGLELTAYITQKNLKELGLVVQDKVVLSKTNSKKKIVCDLRVVESKKILKDNEIGLSKEAFEKFGEKNQTKISVIPSKKPKSLESVRQKFRGKNLDEKEFYEILKDIVNNVYSDIEITFFVLACAIHKLSFKETVALTNSMVNVGKKLDFSKNGKNLVVDKHCIGGIPNNRTTILVIPIIASFNLTIPKTSSRAITSPAGTADTFEIFANVNIPLTKMVEIVEKEKGCMVWGGSFNLSPADDRIIHVEHPLGIDFEVQMIASILSKKKAAGSKIVLIDIPYGENAKVKNFSKAKELQKKFESVGKAIGLKISVILTKGDDVIGRGVGPLYESLDILDILENKNSAPQDLKEKSLFMAGKILELVNVAKKGEGFSLAKEVLESGLAKKKFEQIVKAQGKKQIPKKANFSSTLKINFSGKVKKVHIKKISKLAFMLGAPKDVRSGLYMHIKLFDNVKKGDKAITLYSNSKIKMEFAKHYYETHKEEIFIG